MNISVEMVQDGLVIKVPRDWVYATIVYNEDATVVDPSDAESFPDMAVLENFDSFQDYLISEIRREDETGWSLINDLIYKAAEEALEQGAEGVKYAD